MECLPFNSFIPWVASGKPNFHSVDLTQINAIYLKYSSILDRHEFMTSFLHFEDLKSQLVWMDGVDSNGWWPQIISSSTDSILAVCSTMQRILELQSDPDELEQRSFLIRECDDYLQRVSELLLDFDLTQKLFVHMQHHAEHNTLHRVLYADTCPAFDTGQTYHLIDPDKEIDDLSISKKRYATVFRLIDPFISIEESSFLLHLMYRTSIVSSKTFTVPSSIDYLNDSINALEITNRLIKNLYIRTLDLLRLDVELRLPLTFFIGGNGYGAINFTKKIVEKKIKYKENQVMFRKANHDQKELAKQRRDILALTVLAQNAFPPTNWTIMGGIYNQNIMMDPLSTGLACAACASVHHDADENLYFTGYESDSVLTTIMGNNHRQKLKRLQSSNETMAQTPMRSQSRNVGSRSLLQTR